MFLNTRVLGVRVPFHVNFPEVNLRFYVRYKEGQEWKRGVVFIREILPKPALTFVANKVFRERYWEIYPVNDHKVQCDFNGLYGKNFASLSQSKPTSVFLAEGSGISVYGKRIVSG